ncbi:S8 family serine peptidase, partial [Euzebya sp.]|uniref:S8 family serine peptidase n=1 Tax=Euzebya sp. TaxID=1971409 RepID=UPI003512C859
MPSLRRSVALLAALVLAAALAPAAGAQQPGDPGSFEAIPLEGTTTSSGRAASSRLAQSDESLLELDDPAPVNVVVKLDYDATAAYVGGRDGFEATSPSVTGQSLNPDAAAVRSYEAGVAEPAEQAFIDQLRAIDPSAVVGQRLRTVYGGVAIQASGVKIRDIAAIDGVVAVQRDTLHQALTDSSPEFIGATELWADLVGEDGNTATAGEGVIVGILDSGAWPEHPEFRERQDVDLPPAPERPDGFPRECNFGDNPLTSGEDVFECNDKLIGGAPFIDSYNAFVGDEEYPDSARDSDGHGTHTATTAAGTPTDVANLFGVDRGPVTGIAPGAHVSVYKVCGPQGCFGSDSAAAVAAAIEDDVDVINFSISGGTNPYTDPVELAFLDAYAAGVFVAASAGNDGPGAGTVNHVSPWLTSVAASTQDRAFISTITLTDGSEQLQVDGVSITNGVSTPTDVVLASEAEGYDIDCLEPAPPGTFEGQIVVCERGVIARVAKGWNVLQGGAVGMILYNPPGTTDLVSDNHYLPAVQINPDEGAEVVDFITDAANPQASFTQGVAVTDESFGDIMATFSSRGPGGDFLKPDITAPGVQILAGQTPTNGPPPDGGAQGQYYQAIAGTSMSSPHIAGSAALVMAAHPDWTPGQVRSALMTSARQDVVKEDGTTPADPFDYGAGHVDLTVAAEVGLTFDESADAFTASAGTPLQRIDLNLPSINAPVMPGVVETTRTAVNVTDETATYTVETSAPQGSRIVVEPSTFTVAPGESVELSIRIDGTNLDAGDHFGEIRLAGGPVPLHLPVAFTKTAADVRVASDCAPDAIANGDPAATSTCTVTVSNDSLDDASVDVRTRLNDRLSLVSADGAQVTQNGVVRTQMTLPGREDAAPGIVPAPAGSLTYFALDDPALSTPIPFNPVGDEQVITLNTPAFTYAGRTWTRLSLTSNGYAVAGGASGTEFEPQDLPDPTAPNAVMAPFWTDLNGEEAGSEGIAYTILTDNVDDWIVAEWRMQLWGASGETVDDQVRTFQLWIMVGDTEEVTFTYDPEDLPQAPPPAYGLTVGAENANGTAGDQIDGPPTTDYLVTAAPGAPGGTDSYTLTVRGAQTGRGAVTTSATAPDVFRGTATDRTFVTVFGAPGGDGGDDGSDGSGDGDQPGAPAPGTGAGNPGGPSVGGVTDPPAEDAADAGDDGFDDPVDDPVEEPVTIPESVSRVAGADRMSTAVEISRASFPDGATTAVLATAGTFPDALTAAPAARSADAPILLTGTDVVPQATLDELDRLGVERVVVLGGIAAVSQDAVAALEARGLSVERLEGRDRFTTASAVAGWLTSQPGYADSGTVFIATGDGFADALAGGAAAAAVDAPILLVNAAGVPQATADQLSQLSPQRIVLLGGTAVISDAVAEELAAYGTVERLAGADRFATAVAGAEAFGASSGQVSDEAPSTVFAATGAAFADALAAGPAAAAAGAPLLLRSEERR